MRNYTNGWAYYALLGSDGDYVASDKRVGIDTPPTVQWLKRTGLAKSRIDQRRKEFNSGTSQSQTCGGLREHSIGVLFIEFSGTPHYSSSSIGRPNGYTWTDYNNLLFSEGIYNTAKTGLRSPNNDEVFGSVRDYYSEMSLGNEEISGFSINPIGN